MRIMIADISLLKELRGVCCSVAINISPRRGEATYRIPGGLRGLRPPATFFATLRVANEKSARLKNDPQLDTAAHCHSPAEHGQ